jgi:carbamoyltransferase
MSKTPFNILGVSALYHDSAACFIRDGEIIAAAQEERFSRRKGDARLPINAMRWCLNEGGVKRGEIDLVVFFEKPLTKLLRLLRTHTAVAPSGLKSFLMGVPLWLKEKAWSPMAIERFLEREGFGRPSAFEFCEHHLSHAASAFYPSPFEEAAVLTIDGVGEWTSSALSVGEGHDLRMIYEQRFPHSLGMLYSAFTYFTGFKVNSGEYKLMGLAPYGEPRYVDTIYEHLVDVREDGSFRLNLDYFGYLGGLKMTNDKFAELFGGPARTAESELTRREMDLARSIQVVTEEIILKMARYARAVSGKPYLVLAGGCALNCVANGRLKRSGLFDDIWIQPAAGDAGGALGAALYSWHAVREQPRLPLNGQPDRMKGAFLGPSFSESMIQEYLDQRGYPYRKLSDDEWADYIAGRIAEKKVVGLFRGRMEFGPRALCARSILADARSPETQSFLNLATKFRESFRPFAPVVLQEDAHEYFEEIVDSPYMLLVDQVRGERLSGAERPSLDTDLKTWVNIPRSDVPAITHVDDSARIQTIDRARNPKMHDILTAFKAKTGYGIMVNTSFNVRSEPIVCTPEDAYVCFMRTGMDTLVLEGFVLEKSEQPLWAEGDDWRDRYELD